MIAALYERQNDTVGNLAFEFDVSFHTIRNDIRVLELEYPIYTKVGAGGGVFVLDSSRLQQRWLTIRQRELLMDVCGALFFCFDLPLFFICISLLFYYRKAAADKK